MGLSSFLATSWGATKDTAWLGPKPALAAAERPPIFSDGKGALRGYDPVAYFKSHKPQKGLAQHHHRWKGADWYFASPGNLAAFKKDPKAFAPQYGGYCAYAMAHGRFATTDPKAFSVRNGKLYLNYSLDVQKRFLEKPDSYIKDADKNWLKLNPAQK